MTNVKLYISYYFSLFLRLYLDKYIVFLSVKLKLAIKDWYIFFDY